MFKNTQRTANGQLLFSYASLWAFFFPYFIMAFLTFGIAVPSGLFIPSLVSGAALGRILGQALNSKR
jgi:H+/Cl- antiporter ClcA